MDRKLNRLFARYRRRDDTAALGQVFDLAAPELARVARYLVKAPDTVEDLIQATFLTVIEKRASFDDNLAVMPWLLGILAKHAAKGRRAAHRQPDPQRLSEQQPCDPSRAAEASELGRLIEVRLRELPRGYMDVVRAFLTEGCKPQEIGMRLGITANAASVRLHRGLRLLRKSLPAGAAYGLAAPAPDLGRVRAQVLIAALPSQLSATLARPSAATLSTSIGALLMKQSLALCLGLILLGAGVYRFMPATQQASNPSVADTSNRVQAMEPDVQAGLPSTPPASRIASPATSDHEASARVAIAPEASSSETWLERILRCKTPDAAQGVFEEIAALDAAQGLGIMQSAYPQIPRADFRERSFPAFLQTGHVHAVDVLHLGTSDQDLKLQVQALARLSDIAFIDFSASFDKYAPWITRFAGQAYVHVLRTSAKEFVARTQLLERAPLLATLQRFERLRIDAAQAAGVDLRQVLLDAGILPALEEWLQLPEQDFRRTAMRWAEQLGVLDRVQAILSTWLASNDPELRRSALRWMAQVNPSEEFIQERILPILHNRDQYTPQLVDDAVRLLGQPGFGWAVDDLLAILLNPSNGTGRFFRVSKALAEIGDARVVPTMIAVIAADDTYDSIYGVGYFGLEGLTGVAYDEQHDGAFWIKWWDKNRSRMPASVRGLPIPFVSFDK